jgi:hypothetical protein
MGKQIVPSSIAAPEAWAQLESTEKTNLWIGEHQQIARRDYGPVQLVEFRQFVMSHCTTRRSASPQPGTDFDFLSSD